MTLQILAAINKRTISSAGPRYTPGLDALAPNVQIGSLLAAIEGLAVNDRFRQQIDQLKTDLSERWSLSARHLSHRQAVEASISLLLDALDSLSKAMPGSSSSVLGDIKKFAKKTEQYLKKQTALLDEKARARRDEIRRVNKGDETEASSRTRGDSVLNTIDEKREGILQLEIVLRKCLNFCDTPACALRFNNVGLLTGSWGTGKTHFLCDVATRYMSEGKPALVMLARDVEPGESCGDSLASASSLAPTFDGLLKKLNAFGKAHGQRTLILIDGINESDNKAWRRDLRELVGLVRSYDYVGLILSCREPFERAIFPSRLYNNIPKIQHRGFDEIEFDAQKTFFEYYKIPLPEVPLLAEEFSRPLTLKILCQAFRKLPKKEREKGFHGISSGQKGMTFILEQFVHERTKDVEATMALPPKFCWRLLKGDPNIVDARLAGFAPYMADRLEEWIPYDQVMRIIRARPEIRTGEKAKTLLRLLVKEGIVYDHMLWRARSEGGPLRVLGLPYQRFTDHIVARHLLDKYLIRSSPRSVRSSFRKSSHLGSIFQIKGHYRQYYLENWAEAIIVEFPEFVKNVLPKEERELFFYLPKKLQDIEAYFKPFVGGLVWRAPPSICRQTDRMVGTYFWGSHEPWRREISEALISVATKPKHPYSGLRLFKNLSRIPMVKRDLSWSELLRKAHYPGTAVERVVSFYEHSSLDKLSPEAAENAIGVLAAFLTTTDRLLRDRATKGLVRLAEICPRALFDCVRASIRFDDPYAIERVTAAAFGVAMRRYSDPPFKEDFLVFARWVVKEFFLPKGKARTHHALLRGYAYGIVELAGYIHPKFLRKSWEKALSPPFKNIPDPFRPVRHISHSVKRKTSGAMFMDFANYTLGRLVPNRQNYDMNHRVYKQVRKQIEWRMVDLGYDQALFKDIDLDIGRDSWRERPDGRKVDRYGKKYSWIAYFEMYGLREAQGTLPDVRAKERSPDSDIDPSFPEYRSNWSPNLPNLFLHSPSAVVPWLSRGPTPDYDDILVTREIEGIEGPWIALDGYVQQTQPDDKREIFTFVRGLLMAKEGVNKFSDKFYTIDYPGNSAIPDPGEDHYTYAGEIPWSSRFASELRDASGHVKRQLTTVFNTSEKRPKRERVKGFWAELYRLLPASDIINISLRALSLSTQDDPEQKRISAAIECANNAVPKSERIRSNFEMLRPPTADEAMAGVRITSEYVRAPGIAVELPTWGYGWESYHSAANKFSGFDSLAPALCNELALQKRGDSADLLDATGRVATVFRRWKDAGASLPSHLIYIREDMLLTYLEKTAQVLILAVWGEREFHYDISETYRARSDVQEIWSKHTHVHRQLRMFSSVGLVPLDRHQ